MRSRVAPRVVCAHPLTIVPPMVTAVGVGLTADAVAAKWAFIIAAGSLLCVEGTARLLVVRAWHRRVWPPTDGEPAALLLVLAAPTWTAAWWSALGPLSLASPGAGAGVKAAAIIALIQFASWVVASRPRPTEPQVRTASDRRRVVERT
ncbi:MAG: hypothetical protein KY469_14815 [Actinobacteria bacterium]|nr:hypothetical protein [Actinomycetota bacterium]